MFNFILDVFVIDDTANVEQNECGSEEKGAKGQEAWK
jgi:hypothetical protein